MPKFKFIKTKIDGLTIIEPQKFSDERGYFMETYNYNEFKNGGINANFVQDNQSESKKGVLRGLHFQTKNSQGKLVRVLKGEVFDVAVDLRKGSPTFGQWYGLVLSRENKVMFYIPESFAHGFLVLSETAEFAYKCTNFYSPEFESGIIWNDPEIGIDWPFAGIEHIILSEKDQNHRTFRDYKESLKLLEAD